MSAAPAGGVARGAAAPILARSSLRFFLRHPAQLALSVLGIVLGVGVVTAVLITNSSASRAFALSSETLQGRATHAITGADGLDGARYAALRRAWPGVPMAPVIEGHVALGNEVLTLVGLDPFAEGRFERFGRGEGAGGTGGLDAALAEAFGPSGTMGGAADGTADGGAPGETARDPLSAVAVAAATLGRLGLELGAPVRVRSPAGEREIVPVAPLESDEPAAVEGIVVADIALAQELLARGTRIDRIEIVAGEALAARVGESLPETLRLVGAATRNDTMEAMTRGFRINLTAMSLLALVVGAFLIHNTMTFAVLQRRELFATLRIVGVTAGQVFASVLAEAAAIALVGAALGVALGRLLAEFLIGLTTRTINDLYFVLHVQEVSFGAPLALAGLALGTGASLAAASIAAREAAGINPVDARRRSLVEGRAAGALPALAAAGAVAGVVGGALALLPVQSLVVGFAALMLLILGYGLALPFAVHRLAGALAGPAAALGPVAALAVGGVARNISRTGLAIAALAVAVSATFGVEVMISSFRQTVDDWLTTTLGSDVYVSSPSSVSVSSQALLEPGVEAAARSTPGIGAVSTGRVIDVATGVGTIEALVLEPHPDSLDSFDLVDREGEPLGPDAALAAWEAFEGDGAVLASEPLGTKHGLGAGDALALFTGRAGERDFPVAGTFRDYASSNGKLLVSRATWDAWWDDPEIGSLGLMIEDGADAAAVVEDLRARLGAVGQPLQVQSNAAIHDASLEVFDRTFEVTRVLRWLTVGVAFVGIFSALLALHLERGREFATLRATGATRAQVGGIVMGQTLLMGLFAGLLALPLGWLMSQMLIHVINVRSFGWRMEAMLPAGATASTVALAAGSALLAGLWPAWRLTRADIASRLRED